MAQTRKYAHLPDLDEAPDIYETPEILKGTAATGSATARSPSQASSQDEQEEDDESGIDRRRLQADEARNRFQPSRVDAKGVDFSDCISKTRKSYRVSRRRKRRDAAGNETEIGDLSDEEDEPLDRKLARLRAEIDQITEQLDQQKAEKETAGDTKEGEESDEDEQAVEVQKISDALDAVYVQKHGSAMGAEAMYARALRRFTRTYPISQPDGTPVVSGADDTQTPMFFSGSAIARFHHTHALAKAAEFDSRLSTLEKALGLNGLNMPQESPGLHFPILHKLDGLEEQLSLLSANSTEPLDAASRRVHQLLQEAERLDAYRKATRAAQDAQPVTPKRAVRKETLVNGDTQPPDPEDPERVAKINALYSTLTTIDSLSPTLPIVLERLRSLRLVHQSAGMAKTTLDELEERQTRQAAEIKKWRDELEKVEENMIKGEKVWTENVKGVGEWMKHVEERIQKFS